MHTLIQGLALYQPLWIVLQWDFCLPHCLLQYDCVLCELSIKGWWGVLTSEQHWHSHELLVAVDVSFEYCVPSVWLSLSGWDSASSSGPKGKCSSTGLVEESNSSVLQKNCWIVLWISVWDVADGYGLAATDHVLWLSNYPPMKYWNCPTSTHQMWARVRAAYVAAECCATRPTGLL